MANSFRTKSGEIAVDVNDQGGKVTLYVSDENWSKGFYDYLNYLEKRCKELSEQETADNKMALTVQFCEEAKEHFDPVFGEGAYMAVFGDHTVGIEYVFEFLEYAAQYVSERAKEREALFSKYSPEKTGGAG